MRGLVALLTFLLTVSQVSALSCLRPDVVRSFQQVATSDKVYVAFYGELSFDPSAFPKNIGVPIPERDNAVRIPARFEGHGLNRDGFVVPLELSVTIEAQCFAAWCGQLQQGRPTLAFAQKLDETYLVEVDPCGSKTFTDPADEDLARVVACLRGEACEPAE